MLFYKWLFFSVLLEVLQWLHKLWVQHVSVPARAPWWGWEGKFQSKHHLELQNNCLLKAAGEHSEATLPSVAMYLQLWTFWSTSYIFFFNFRILHSHFFFPFSSALKSSRGSPKIQCASIKHVSISAAQCPLNKPWLLVCFLLPFSPEAVFTSYYLNNPPGACFSMPILLSLLWALLKAGMVSDIFSILNVSVTHKISVSVRPRVCGYVRPPRSCAP